MNPDVFPVLLLAIVYGALVVLDATVLGGGWLKAATQIGGVVVGLVLGAGFVLLNE